MSAKERITEADLSRLKRAIRDAAARGQFDFLCELALAVSILGAIR